MAKKTMKQLEEELEAEIATKESLQRGYDTLLAQAQQLQGEHGKRLAFLRILEGFANTVDAALAQVKRDIQELNATFAEEASEEERED
tara:strand:+ start:5120 stop:5383 length:264 start_codon:yes stop_codon:yes gene_type:complete